MFSVCAHCLFSVQWAPLTGTWLCLLYSSPLGINEILPGPSLLQAKQSHLCQLLLVCQMLQKHIQVMKYLKTDLVSSLVILSLKYDQL